MGCTFASGSNTLKGLELDADNRPMAVRSSNVGSEACSWFQGVTFHFVGQVCLKSNSLGKVFWGGAPSNHWDL